jgi:hypothetical protein
MDLSSSYLKNLQCVLALHLLSVFVWEFRLPAIIGELLSKKQRDFASDSW